MDLRCVGVVGAGAVGCGVAQLCLQAGIEVVLVDDTEEVLSDAEDRILKALHRAEQPGAFGLMRKATRLDRVGECDFVVECAAEAPEAKQDLLCRLDARLERPRPLASQTGALPLNMVGRSVENPDRIVGLHFFLPVPIMGLVEVIRGEHSSDKTVETALDLVKRIGKRPIRCKDSPGFVVNRVTLPFYRTAMELLEQGRGTPAWIDGAMRNLGGLRAGPFEILDFLGLEESLANGSVIYELLGRPDRLKPCVVQERLVERGFAGRREAGGFYVYDGKPGEANPVLEQLVEGLGQDPAPPPDIVRRVLEKVFAEAHAVADEGIAAAEDVDAAIRLALGWPKGPFEWEKELGR